MKKIKNVYNNYIYFVYDKLGRIVEVKTGGEVTERYSYATKGRTVTVTDGKGSDYVYSYDAFGSPYLGNLDNDIGFGYCGKVYNVGTGLYDYGFRDYSPVSARFTTVDPIRDGTNWFAYVVNDPVNYVDLLGLSASDSGNLSEKSSASRNLSRRGYSNSTEGYNNCIPSEEVDHIDVIATYEKNNQNILYVAEIKHDKNGNVIDVNYQDYNATNNVSTPEQRGNPVYYKGYYYYPTQFPNGSWNINRSHVPDPSDPYIGPISISTNANQNVTCYEYDSDNKTYTPTGTVNDTGYSIHSGIGDYTRGCIKMSEEDVASFATIVDGAIDSGGSTKLIVY